MHSNKNIRKNIQKILSENFEQGIDYFVDKINNIDIYKLIGRPNESVDSATGTIKFTIELEVKQWGIEGVSINVIDLIVERVIINDETDEKRTETVAYIKDKIPKNGFKIYITKKSGTQISVYDANINEATKEINIVFHSL